MKFKKQGFHYISENERIEITNNKHLDNDDKDWSLYVDGMFCEYGKTLKELKKRAKDFE